MDGTKKRSYLENVGFWHLGRRPSHAGATNRIRITAIISNPDRTAVEATAHAAAGELCETFGGCQTRSGIGSWAPDGAENKSRYQPSTPEPSMEITLTVGEEEADRAEVLLKSAVTRAARRHAPAIDWVHVEKHRLDTSHFQISALPPEN